VSGDGDPRALYDLAVAMRDCVAAELAAQSLPAPDRSVVTVGEIAWDECPCGQLAVTLVEVFPADTPPTPTLGLWRKCPPSSRVAHYTVELLRCAHGTTGGGDPPTPAELSADALLAIRDAWAVRQGIACCLRTLAATNAVADFSLGTQSMVGPAGGCVGSELAVYVVMPLCECRGA
jgi:hypothetical protein